MREVRPNLEGFKDERSESQPDELRDIISEEYEREDEQSSSEYDELLISVIEG